MKLAFTVVVLAGPLAALDTNAQQSNYSHRLSTQLQAMELRPEQEKDFQRIVKRYHRGLESAPRRVQSRGRGDFHTMIKREAKQIGKRYIKDMTQVLDEDQMKHFERYVKISEQRFIASMGLD